MVTSIFKVFLVTPAKGWVPDSVQINRDFKSLKAAVNALVKFNKTHGPYDSIALAVYEARYDSRGDLLEVYVQEVNPSTGRLKSRYRYSANNIFGLSIPRHIGVERTYPHVHNGRYL